MQTKQQNRPAYDRVRERAHPYVVSGQLYGERVLNGVKTTLANQARVKTFTNLETMHDWVTPGFEQISADGGLVSSPMEKLRTTYQGGDTGFMVSLTNAMGKETWEETRNAGAFYFGPPVPSPTTIDVLNLERYTATKALSEVKTASFMGFVAAAEARKTLRMLANPIGSVASLLQYIGQLRKAKKNIVVEHITGGIRRINGREFRTQSYKARNANPGPGKVIREPRGSITIPFGEAVSGTVLAFNLGLRPLMMDVAAILRDIPKAHQLERQTYRTKAEESQNLSRSEVYVSGGYSFYADLATTHKITCRSTIVAEDVFDVLQDFGVSLFDVPEAMWEVIPHSFVVDYWLNIGDYLGALRALATQKIALACVVTTIDTVVKRTWTDTKVVSPWVVERKLVGQDQYSVLAKTRRTGLDYGLARTPWSHSLRDTALQNQLSLICQQLIGLSSGKKKTPFY